MRKSNRRRIFQIACATNLESLESRRLLSAALPKAILAPTQALTNPSETFGRTGGTTSVNDDDGLTLAYTPPTHMLENLGGYLSAPAQGQPLDIARAYLTSHAGQMGLTAGDITNAIVTDQYTDPSGGITHIYLRQTYNGLPVVGAEMGVHVMSDGRILSATSSFITGLKSATDFPAPAISSLTALDRAASALSLKSTVMPAIAVVDGLTTTLNSASLSLDPIPATVMYYATADGPKLAWDMVMRPPDHNNDWYNIAIDANTGATVFSNNWTDHLAQYDVYPLPNESPSDGPRSIVPDPSDSLASPFGWHDTNGVAGAESTLTLGNNVSAYTDTNADNVIDTGSQPDGGAALNFDFPIDLSQAPSTYRPAAVANLFYWNNVIHDIHYHYGFTEAAGNFQTNNYGRGGTGNDPVKAEAQDGGGTNNANFSTPPDGSSGRMQMYVWTSTSPQRDGDLDATVMAHEYGHGVSNRLTGGPANANALVSLQSGGMGEGWSDFYALMFTQTASDTMTTSRGMGTYVIGQPPTGGGIRRYPYNFDMNVNPLTYENYNGPGNSEVHRGGEIWCSTLWDLNWLLIQKYGYDSNLYTGYTAAAGPGHAGNKLALQLVMNGMKLQPANPSMLQARDAILQADVALTGGANQKEIWKAFARRGMGQSAFDGGNADSTAVSAAFDTPASLNLDSRVVLSTPNAWTTVINPAGSIAFTFQKAMDTSSFSIASDVLSFTSPTSGNLLPAISGFSWSADAKTLTVNFTPQSTVGTYTMVIGPNILSADNSHPMDQDMDDTAGEAIDDRYTATFTYNPTVGPDSFGYQARAWQFENLDLVPGSAGVTTLIDNTDDSSVSIPLGTNAFNFYGTTFTGSSQLFASSNGLITFGSSNSSAQNTTLISSPSQRAIAVLWNDWVTNQTPTDQVVYKYQDLNGDAVSDRLIIEWNDVPGFNGGTNGVTFQAILQLNTGSQPGSIVLNYPELDAGNFGYNNGGSASVGIKDAGTQGGNRLFVARDLVNNPLFAGSGKALRIATDWTAPTVTNSGFVYLTSPQQLTYQFSENVAASLAAGDLTLANTTTATVIPAGNISLQSYNTGTNTATFAFPGYTLGTLPDGNYTATLSGVTDAAWNPLGGSSAASFFVLTGDANHDKSVDTTDFNILAANFGQLGKNYGEGDFNYDSSVDTTDFNLLAAHFSQTLPGDTTASVPLSPLSSASADTSAMSAQSSSSRSVPPATASGATSGSAQSLFSVWPIQKSGDSLINDPAASAEVLPV